MDIGEYISVLTQAPVAFIAFYFFHRMFKLQDETLKSLQDIMKELINKR